MKIKILYTKTFLKSAKRLPKPQKEKLTLLLEILLKEPFDPRLHSKSLTGDLAGFYSFRITRDWRVIFRFLDPETIQLIDTAHRKNIYK